MTTVPFDTVGPSVGIHPISLRGASAAVRLWRKNEVPVFLWVAVVLHWIQLEMIFFSKSSAVVREGQTVRCFKVSHSNSSSSPSGKTAMPFSRPLREEQGI